MSKPSHIQNEDTDVAVISDVQVPDLTSAAWTSGDQNFLQVEGQQAVGEVYLPGSDGLEDTSVIEFAVADIPADSLLADIDNYDLDTFDLNDLLKQVDTPPGSSGMESTDAETALAAKSSPFDVNGLPVNMAFPQLTIVIDDEPDPGTVAI